MTQRARTLLVWAVLLAAFVAIFGLGLETAIKTALKLLGLTLLAGALAFVVVMIIRVRTLPRRFAPDYQQAEAALARGDFATARAIFERWWPTFPPVFPEALYGRARVLARQGQLQQAIDLLEEEKRKDTRPSSKHRVELATYYALAGDLVEATKEIQWAAESGSLGQHYDAVSAFARAVIDCRSNRCSDAARLLDEYWQAIERITSGQQLRPLRIVRAFAHSNGGAQGGGAAEAALVTVRPAYPGEHDYLGHAWPEMARYLAQNGLSS